MGKLDLALLVGDESKKWLANLTAQVDRLEKLVGKTAGVKAPAKPAAAVDEDDAEVEASDEDEDFAPKVKPKKKKAAASFDDDADEEAEEETVDTEDDEPIAEDDADEEDVEDDFAKPAPKKKSKKAAAVTVDDVNDACKTRAAATGGKKGRAEVLAILKKKFKTESVSELKPEQYEDCIAAMAVNQ